MGLGSAYLMSPTWRIEVTCTSEALAVHQRNKLRFRLPWNEVVRVVASKDTSTCFIDGGSAQRSLLVPGVGAHASYSIENSAALYRAAVAHVAPHLIQYVALLETAPVKDDTDESAPTVPND